MALVDLQVMAAKQQLETRMHNSSGNRFFFFIQVATLSISNEKNSTLISQSLNVCVKKTFNSFV